mmetsp:Transcript_176599/g.566256  ORF Transcript_176599/g.566256 Transcript_176599/m.566256 type:complete len:233 (+) Transcript_176599:177-875(+)
MQAPGGHRGHGLRCPTWLDLWSLEPTSAGLAKEGRCYDLWCSRGTLVPAVADLAEKANSIAARLATRRVMRCAIVIAALPPFDVGAPLLVVHPHVRRKARNIATLAILPVLTITVRRLPRLPARTPEESETFVPLELVSLNPSPKLVHRRIRPPILATLAALAAALASARAADLAAALDVALAAALAAALGVAATVWTLAHTMVLTTIVAFNAHNGKAAFTTTGSSNRAKMA